MSFKKKKREKKKKKKRRRKKTRSPLFLESVGAAFWLSGSISFNVIVKCVNSYCCEELAGRGFLVQIS